MARRFVFIETNGDAIARAGKTTVRPIAVPGRIFIIDPAQIRLLLGGAYDLDDLAYRGGAVVVRDAAEIAARDAARIATADDRFIDSPRERAFLILLLDQINVLRAAAGLSTISPAQAKSAYLATLAGLRA